MAKLKDVEFITEGGGEGRGGGSCIIGSSLSNAHLGGTPEGKNARLEGQIQ